MSCIDLLIQVYEAAPDSMILVRPDGTIACANARTEELGRDQPLPHCRTRTSRGLATESSPPPIRVRACAPECLRYASSIEPHARRRDSTRNPRVIPNRSSQRVTATGVISLARPRWSAWTRTSRGIDGSFQVSDPSSSTMRSVLWTFRATVASKRSQRSTESYMPTNAPLASSKPWKERRPRRTHRRGALAVATRGAGDRWLLRGTQ